MVKMKLLYPLIAYLRYRDLSQKREKQQIFDSNFPAYHKALLVYFQYLISKRRSINALKGSVENWQPSTSNITEEENSEMSLEYKKIC